MQAMKNLLDSVASDPKREKLEAEAREAWGKLPASGDEDVSVRVLSDWAGRIRRDAVAPVAGALRDLLRDVDARFQLDQGFKGMGHNILTESAGRLRVDAEHARKVLADLDARAKSAHRASGGKL